jgi:hypothetical protein
MRLPHSFIRVSRYLPITIKRDGGGLRAMPFLSAMRFAAAASCVLGIGGCSTAAKVDVTLISSGPKEPFAISL